MTDHEQLEIVLGRLVPANRLVLDHLVVDRHAVFKVLDVDRTSKPYLEVDARLRNQVTGAEGVRVIPWNQQVAVDYPLHKTISGAHGKEGTVTESPRRVRRLQFLGRLESWLGTRRRGTPRS